MDRLSSLLELFKPAATRIVAGRLADLNAAGEDSSIIALVQQGKAHFTSCEMHTPIHPGDLLWISNTTDQHIAQASADFELLNCHLEFGPQHLNPLFDLLPAAVLIERQDPARCELEPVINILLQESQQHRCGQAPVVNRLAEILLIHVLRYLMGHQKLELGVIAGLSDIRLARAIIAIHQQPEHNWSVTGLAAEAGMSRTAFNQHFRDTVGSTPGEYLSRWRMRLACQWLTTSNLAIAQIADQLGYQSETAFFRAFRRELGQSPGQYRAATAEPQKLKA